MVLERYSLEKTLKPWTTLINTKLLWGILIHHVILIQITPPTWSFYGLTFDVISQEQAINVAYTNVNLPYHMDLIYMESAPGLQYLLCRKNDKSVVGGTSILVDTFAVAEELKEIGLHKDFLRLFSHAYTMTATVMLLTSSCLWLQIIAVIIHGCWWWYKDFPVANINHHLRWKHQNFASLYKRTHPDQFKTLRKVELRSSA